MNQIKEVLKKIKDFLVTSFKKMNENEDLKRTLSGQKSRWINLWRKYRLNKVVLLLFLLLVLIASIHMVFLAKSANVSSLKDGLSRETVFYDKDGDQAGTVSRNKGAFVPMAKISPNLSKAVVATEDKRFYQHKGFDLKGIGRAAVGYIVHFGRISGGGSTITQQLAKNAYLSLDQKLSRKMKELFLALEIERNYSKDEILEMYLNHVYFGNGVYGVEDASHRYFGKPASDLNLSEAATLAGMLKGPSLYNPIDHYDQAINRRNTVLEVMAKNGVISEADKQAAQASDLHLANTYQANSDYRYPSYFDAVINEAINRYGLTEEEIMERGYSIYTALDQNMQGQMDRAMNGAYYPDHPDGTMVQTASVAMDPQTGGVRALYGGRDKGEHVFRGFNRATQMRVQPASTLKPLAVYTPALEAGYKPDDLLKDEKLSYGKDRYTPENWNHAYQGQVTMREAIALSWNAPAVWLMDKVGLDKGIDKLKQFGIHTDEKDHYLGVALGGLTEGVSPMQMASAYTAFANKGIRAKGYLIREIVDASGKVIVSNKRPTTYKVTTPNTAKVMTSMLLNVYSNNGTGASAQNGYQMAGKTGTTVAKAGDEDKAGYQWMIAYTPDIVVATWLGYDKTDAEHHLEGGSQNHIGPLFGQEMANIISVTKQTPFGTQPDWPNDWENAVRERLNSTLKGFGEGAKQFGDRLGQKLGEKGKEFLQKAGQWLEEKMP
ncbi:PBP1A family penicillin-binding protein [Atopobacter sp. AH10]|uniref:transglycosylase domain-containing protein n=1 Tax=Atopobacter sp. AH10 TaxID=2315861 RepID=UPI000EF1AB00|nr:PBP1A family penicillin-binding protein [Atopobacter sp. AH10]RLK63682.1 PBP1A family penicillin-binding protein [Atopobacter sp. AH10]